LSEKLIDETEKQHPLKGKKRVDLFQNNIQRVARAETLNLAGERSAIRDRAFKWNEEWLNGVESQTNFEPLSPQVSSPIKVVSKYN